MPYYKRHRKKKAPYKRYRNRKRKTYTSKYNPRNTIPGMVFPRSCYCKLNYGREMKQVSIAGNSYEDFFILANGLTPLGVETAGNFPQSAVGNQIPSSQLQSWQGLQAYNRIYSRFHVLSCKAHLKFFSESLAGASTNINLQIIASAWVNFGATTGQKIAASSTSLLMQQKGVKRRIISGSGGRNWAKITMNKSSRRMIGIKKLVDDPNTACDMNQTFTVSPPDPISNPSPDSQWFYHVRVLNPNAQPTEVSWSLYLTCNAFLSQPLLWSGMNTASNAPPTS